MTDADQRAERLIEYEALYHTTGNALYAWQALVQECQPNEPLPGWIFDYLRGAAWAELADGQPPWRWRPGRDEPASHDLLDLTEPAPDDLLELAEPASHGLLDLAVDHDRSVTPAQAAEKVAVALGLTRPGWNAFADYRAATRENMVAMVYDAAKSRTKAEAVATRMATGAGITTRTLYNMVRRARARWAAQRAVKGNPPR